MKGNFMWFFLFMPIYLFAEPIILSERFIFAVIRDGNWALLNDRTTPHDLHTNGGFESLFEMDRNELRVLRNAFYAKYGYKFSSKDLQEYFNQFAWYNGTKENVDSELSDAEKRYIDIIRRIESNYPQSLNKDIVGFWIIEDGITPYTWYLDDHSKWYNYLISFDHFRICQNGTFYYFGNYSIHGIYGLWSFDNNVFSINSLSNEPYIYKTDLSNIKNNVNQNLRFSEYISGDCVFLESNLTRDQKKWIKLSEYPYDFYK
jgi:hypothetical protein